ncbi:MAG: CapA family protein [Leptonema sp. (in: Bacteria)]|nr:CapA family protein [Leptonema sp. (in: bacteria)]
MNYFFDKYKLTIFAAVILIVSFLPVIAQENNSTSQEQLSNEPTSNNQSDNSTANQVTNQITNQTNLPQNDEIRLLFAGDTHFLWGVKDQQNRKGIFSPLAKIKPLFDSADYRVINLETVISAEGKSINNKTYVFRSEPENLNALRQLGVNTVFLANNHTIDLGAEGIKQTIQEMKKSGIGFTGLGLTEAEAITPHIAEIGNIKIAFYSVNLIGSKDTFAIGNQPGTGYITPGFYASLKAVKRLVNYVVVGVHWGKEYEVFSTDDQRDLARTLLRNGADAIIGHHSHVPQGVEIIDGKPVIYSLGNFLFGSANYQQTDNLIAVIQVNRKTMKLSGIELMPVTGQFRKTGYVLDIPSIEDRSLFFEEMFLMCRKLNPYQKITVDDRMAKMVIQP